MPDDSGFNLIYSYTRKQAIEDGVLVDVSEMAREAGFRIPAAITDGVEEIVTPDDHATAQGETRAGRLWDVLWMCYAAIKRQKDGQPQLLFRLYVTRHGSRNLVTLKAICGPGDDREPVLTIMMPHED